VLNSFDYIVVGGGTARSISGLRMPDSSVIHSIVTGYTIATVYAIAERAAK
jgi:choline dehydrogenase-like flavoprotein